jgi:hypothetical protein
MELRRALIDLLGLRLRKVHKVDIGDTRYMAASRLEGALQREKKDAWFSRLAQHLRVLGGWPAEGVLGYAVTKIPSLLFPPDQQMSYRLSNAPSLRSAP